MWKFPTQRREASQECNRQTSAQLESLSRRGNNSIRMAGVGILLYPDQTNQPNQRRCYRASQVLSSKDLIGPRRQQGPCNRECCAAGFQTLSLKRWIADISLWPNSPLRNDPMVSGHEFQKHEIKQRQVRSEQGHKRFNKMKVDSYFKNYILLL